LRWLTQQNRIYKMNFTRKTEYWILATLAAAQFTHIVDFMIMMPMGDILQKVLEVSPFQYSLLVAAYPVAAFLSSLFGVFLLDRFDRRRALLLAYAGFVLGTLSSAFIPNTSVPELNYYLFILTRIITGLSGGILTALVLSIVGDVFPIERRGKAMGIVMSAFSLAAVLGVPIGLGLVNMFGGNWHPPFIMVGGLGLLVIVMIWFAIPSITSHIKSGNVRPGPLKSIKNAAALPNQQLALLFSLLLVLGQFSIIPFLTPYLINNVGFTQHQIPYIYLVGGACTAITSPLLGIAVDKFGRKKVFFIAAVLSLFPTLIITHLAQTEVWIVLIVVAFFFVLVGGRMIPANTLLTSVVKPENRGGFLSLNSSVMSLGSGLASVVGGSIVIQQSPGLPLENYGWVGIVACTSTIIAILIATKLKELDAKGNTV